MKWVKTIFEHPLSSHPLVVNMFGILLGGFVVAIGFIIKYIYFSEPLAIEAAISSEITSEFATSTLETNQTATSDSEQCNFILENVQIKNFAFGVVDSSGGKTCVRNSDISGTEDGVGIIKY